MSHTEEYSPVPEGQVSVCARVNLPFSRISAPNETRNFASALAASVVVYAFFVTLSEDGRTRQGEREGDGGSLAESRLECTKRVIGLTS